VGEGTQGGATRKRSSVSAKPEGDAPLQELSRDRLSVFLYLALLPEETRQLVKELGLGIPGFRTEALGDAERCDLLADEIRASPEARGPVLGALRSAFSTLPLASVRISARAAQDLLELGGTEHGLTLALWRVLADPSARVRAVAGPVLDQLVAEYYQSQPDHGLPREPPRVQPGDRAAALEKELAQVREDLGQAREDLEEARQRFEREREKLQQQLREARAQQARADEEAARARTAADEVQRALARSDAALGALRTSEPAVEAQRARSLARDLEGQLASAQSRLERERERVRELQAALDQARAALAPGPTAQPAAPADEPGEPEDVPATWLMPIFTREFYDSLQGWDRRIQRAAFKQASLLAQDHRHPSLRAIPLEGLPGYYRVRVATDVRLLYRRLDKQNDIEVLSLIDREDLDRYVKQAKSRS
jgi:mRNA-degrading endonuclease RelE of RelBE toxin-antitoxin system